MCVCAVRPGFQRQTAIVLLRIPDHQVKPFFEWSNRRRTGLQSARSSSSGRLSPAKLQVDRSGTAMELHAPLHKLIDAHHEVTIHI